MEQIFWRDIEDLAGNWSGLGVDVKRPCAAKPPLRLLSGDNLRMQLVLGDQTLLWGTLSRCYYGVWLIRNTLLEQLPLTLVEAIDSPTVEQHAQLAPALRLKAWSRFSSISYCTSSPTSCTPATGWCAACGISR